jgi:formate dehydrogenase major subunit
MDISRRQFLKAGGTAAAASSMAALGFGASETALAQAVRPFKLSRSTETRNTCPYCSVSCGILMYSLGDRSKNAKAEIFHIEGDPDHPVNRGTLCPKGAGLLDFVRAKTRTKYPMYRKPGSDKFERVEWDWALDRIAKLMKEDRDRNFIAQNQDGATVNRWLSTGILAASASTNETAWLTYKVIRSTGILAFDNQARV